MESILKSDIFFFITAICVFVVTALVVMILAEVLQIVKNIRHISDHLKGEASNLAADFAAFRVVLQNNQFGFKPIFDGIKKTASAFTKSKPRSSKKKPFDTVRHDSPQAAQGKEQESEFI
jgi:hypothetical protein